MVPNTHVHIPADKQVDTWLRLEVFAFVLQTLILVSGIIYGYARLESKVDELNRKLNDHISNHNAYLQRETWETRNRFIDQKLDDISRKLDVLMDSSRKVR